MISAKRLHACFTASMALAATIPLSIAKTQASTAIGAYDTFGRLVAAKTLGESSNNEARLLCHDEARNRIEYGAILNGAAATCVDFGLSSAIPASPPTPTPSAASISIGDAPANESGSLTFTILLSEAQATTTKL